MYKVIFNEIKINSKGEKIHFLHSKSGEKLTSRKAVFEFLEEINQRRTKRWSYNLKPGERIECENIEIQEDKIVEKTLSNGKIVKRKEGFETYTPGKYRMTFCKICGRTLTDPLSVSRGIGPECYSKYKQ